MLDARSSMLDAGREMDRMEGNVTNAANVTDQSWAAGSHKDLAVHQLAHPIAVKLHKFSLRLPKYELYETGSQLRRSSKSVSANIVEGYGRWRYKAEFMKSLIHAQASRDGTVEWVEYVRDCHEDLAEAAQPFLQELDELGRKLNRFTQAVESGHRSPK